MMEDKSTHPPSSSSTKILHPSTTPPFPTLKPLAEEGGDEGEEVTTTTMAKMKMKTETKSKAKTKTKMTCRAYSVLYREEEVSFVIPSSLPPP